MYATVVVADSKMGHGCNAYSPGKTDAVDSKIGVCCGDPQVGLLLLSCWIIHRRTIFMENRVEGKCKRGSLVNSNRKEPDYQPVLTWYFKVNFTGNQECIKKRKFIAVNQRRVYDFLKPDRNHNQTAYLK